MKCILDIETNRLENPDVIHCIVCKDIETKEVKSFVERECYEDFPEYAKQITAVIGHNLIGFDLIWLDRLLHVSFLPSIVLDTLVLSKLDYFRREGGHSLENWGRILNFPKGEFNQFDEFSQEMLDYCTQDVHLTHKVYLHLKESMRQGDYRKAIDIEHKLAFLCQEMSENGFCFNSTDATELEKELELKVAELDDAILTSFPPKAKFIKEITPRVTKHGTISKANLPRRWTDLTILSPDSSFSLVEWEPFNPGSPLQVVDRLNRCGWKPTDKTEGHIEAERAKDQERLAHFREYGWRVSEVNLATLPDTAPEAARKLVHRLLLNSRLNILKQWTAACNPCDGRVHGTFESLGTWTHRMSHRHPNLGNVAAEKSIKYKGAELSEIATSLGKRMRSLWTCAPGNYLVGTDAEGIQLRIFAHYIEDEEFIKAVCEGRKEDGTDPHSVNQRALGPICRTRDNAKTFIYAFLLGAGIGKIGDIFGCPRVLAEEAKRNFLQRYPGLEKLKQQVIPRDVKRGYFVGFDGRHVPCDSEHHMLAGYLQTGEALVMKYAVFKAWEDIKRQTINAKLINIVHDEMLFEVTTMEEAVTVKEITEQSIKWAGEHLNLRCPMSGKGSIGTTWYEVH